MWRYLLLTIGMSLGCFTVANAELDPFTEMALESFRESVATHQEQAGQQSLEQQAQYLMQVKNGLTLYREGVLQPGDKSHLVTLVEQQLSVASIALDSSALTREQSELAKRMRGAALAAKQLLGLEPTAATFEGLMERYHNGIGYDAYRYAQDSDIEQL